MTADIHAVLLENLEGMRKSVLWLKRSYTKCARIGVKDQYTEDEFDDFENLASRYARMLDATPQLFDLAEKIEGYCKRFAGA